MTDPDNRKILHIALPSIVSNVTIPLLGLVDTAITGHLGDAVYLAAIAVGTSIFSVCYWIFSFLRMGTGGLTAQAFGRQSIDDCRECLRKALMVAITAGLAIIALQSPIAQAALWMMDTTPNVEHWARTYFHILVWGAPANLALSAINGWFIGMQNAKAPMAIAIGQNILNIILSCTLVLGLHMKVEGVAIGTLTAQWAGVLAAAMLVGHTLKQAHTMMHTSKNGTAPDNDSPISTKPAAAQVITWSLMFRINRDIFLRTACLVAVMFSFTAFGARLGETTLATNALLMQLFLLVSYFMDGYAYAGEALGGNLMGARNKTAFLRLTRRLFLLGIATAALFCAAFLLCGDAFIALLTDNVAVRTSAHSLLWVPVAIPVVSLAAFIYDGLFIGTTATREMLISIAIATAAYFLIVALTSSNSLLWVAFLTYLFLRGTVQHLMMPLILKRF